MTATIEQVTSHVTNNQEALTKEFQEKSTYLTKIEGALQNLSADREAIKQRLQTLNGALQAFESMKGVLVPAAELAVEVVEAIEA